MAVMTASLATGVLGFVFWTIAARGYSAAEVGRASALITSATLLATLSNLSIGSLYERFLPVAGTQARRIIASGRTVIVCAALLLGACFVLVGPTDTLFTTPLELWLFPVFVVILGIFAIQDQTLIGLGRSRTVATKNISQSTIKLILVTALIPVGTGFAVVWAWVIPASLIAFWVGMSTIRRRARAMAGPGALPQPREIAQFYAGSLGITAVGVVVPLVVPLVIVTRLGTEMNAYFSICWLVVSTAAILLHATAAPFVATAAEPDADIRSATIRLIALCGGAGIAGCLILIGIAPWILAIMGPQYAESGTDLIRLMALTLPTVSFVTVYTALARVRRRLRLAVVVQCIFGVVVLCGIVFAADRWGIIGVGYVYLAADIAVVLLLLVPGVRLIRLALDPATTSASFSGTPVPTAASNPTAASEPDRRMTTR
ncbi:Membrane protein involved in the export of O-antigen and teichoic acid [Gordonia westfalica]|uniref:Membrane protein involved in the export of O-antigen and teichoic acid n=2 Tax=Gordonia westfalica TaxID=158898 RepID=A0A1H2LML1_9ACTN|nr:Membrane protein involved in the export of O-antigen and teichoic acid [Gordonia westfalica]